MNRVLAAHTPLGTAWWATRLQGREALSSLYEFRLELKSKDPGIDIQSIIGETCAVECEANPLTARYFSGLVINAAAKGRSGKEHWLFELTLAPKLWFASRRADFKIYQNLTVQAIADKVLQQNAIHYEWRLKNSYKTWEYVVQYGETDLAFLLRLFGHEGIYFWFEHDRNGEKLILADHFSTHEPFAGYETIPYYPPDATRVGNRGTDLRLVLGCKTHFYAWTASRAAEPGKFVQTSYDFKSPSTDLKTESSDPRGHLFDQYEIFSYPGTYTESEQQHGQDYAAARLQGMQIHQNIIALEGCVRGALPGCRFTLKNHPVESYNREFTITQVEFRAQNSDYIGGRHTEEDEASFYAKVSAIPADLQYRTPSDKYRMPRAHGPDTAVVVGPSGLEIHDDKYGRVKVHFHWDRYGKRDGSDSCWIRVASPWAGTDVGTVSIPRIGQEVVVDYEHGDPQRPIITGCVYNAEQMPPWVLPAGNTQSGMMSRSTPGGGPDNFNAVRFENAIGQEVMWLHAERDRKQEVKNNDNLWVGGDRDETILGKREVGITKGDTLGIKEGGRYVFIKEGGDRLEVDNGGRTETICGEEGDKLTVDGGKRVEELNKGREVTVKGGEDKLTVEDGRRVEEFQQGRYVTVEGTAGDVLTVKGGRRIEEFQDRRYVTVEGGDFLTVENGMLYVTVKDGNIVFYTPKTITIKADTEVKITTPKYTLKAPDWHDSGWFHLENYGLDLSFKGIEIAGKAAIIEGSGYYLGTRVFAMETQGFKFTTANGLEGSFSSLRVFV